MNFKTQAETFMAKIGTRRRNPVKIATLASYRSLLDSWVLPAVGDLSLAEVDNDTVKPLVEKMNEAEMSAQTITSVVGLIKAVVKSAVDAKGNQLYPRTWNNEFMDVPAIVKSKQEAPVASPKAVQQAIRRAEGQEKALYALLAGSALRIGEAVALMLGPDDGKNSFWIPESGTLRVRTTVSKSAIQFSTKTVAGEREIDLAPELNEYLKANLPMESGLLFKNINGDLTNNQTLYRHLRENGLNGFHSLRRFRITHLDGVSTPRGLIKFWAGHAADDVTERYIHSGEGLAERKTWAEKAGLGFQLATA